MRARSNRLIELPPPPPPLFAAGVSRVEISPKYSVRVRRPRKVTPGEFSFDSAASQPPPPGPVFGAIALRHGSIFADATFVVATPGSTQPFQAGPSEYTKMMGAPADCATLGQSGPPFGQGRRRCAAIGTGSEEIQRCRSSSRIGVVIVLLIIGDRGVSVYADSGSKINSSICGFGNSPGTRAAMLRARAIASQAAPDWFRLKY